MDSSGNVYIADYNNHRIRMITLSTGKISTIAGTGSEGYSGDGGAATSAQLNKPSGVVLDSSGNVYIADYFNNRIRKIDVSTNLISTIASGFNLPREVDLDSSGNVYIADENNDRIRMINVSTGIISTIAGTGSQGYNGDGVAATKTFLWRPTGVTLDSSGNVYIADYYNHRIRMIDVSTGYISTIAGTHSGGYSGDGGAATSAALFYPTGVALDSSGNVYIADFSNNRIRMIDAITGYISTIAGKQGGSFSGDGGAATSAQLNGPRGVVLDSSGNVYIADMINHRIRKLTPIYG